VIPAIATPHPALDNPTPNTSASSIFCSAARVGCDSAKIFQDQQLRHFGTVLGLKTWIRKLMHLCENCAIFFALWLF
jgi:hypothetical protein